jgi:hypothetical protein
LLAVGGTARLFCVILAGKENGMGEVRTEITLVNMSDKSVADRGFMPQERVRRVTVNAVVDTGSDNLVINEKTRQLLGLRIEEPGEAGRKPAAFASEFAFALHRQTPENGGVKVLSGIMEPVRVHWQDRDTPCKAVLLPDEEDVLLGALPLEGLDLMIHPLRQEVIGAHGDKIRIVVK